MEGCVAEWRALPEKEPQRVRIANIPRKVARSCAFEGEPVDLAMLEELERLLTLCTPSGESAMRQPPDISLQLPGRHRELISDRVGGMRLKDTTGDRNDVEH